MSSWILTFVLGLVPGAGTLHLSRAVLPPQVTVPLLSTFPQSMFQNFFRGCVLDARLPTHQTLPASSKLALPPIWDIRHRGARDALCIRGQRVSMRLSQMFLVSMTQLGVLFDIGDDLAVCHSIS